MSVDRKFFIFLTLSILIHSLIFFNFSRVRFNPPLKDDFKKLEVTYFKFQKDLSLLQRALGDLKKISRLEASSLDKDLSKNTQISKVLDMDISLDKSPPEAKQEGALQATELKKVQIPPLEGKDKLIPGFENYYNVIRNKIKQRAEQKFTGSEEGIVYVSFVVMANGQLKDTKIVEEKSVSSPYLQRIAIQSIQDASPYPVFPKEVNFSILSVKLPISFEIK